MSKTLYFVGSYEVEGVENYASIQECVDYLEALPEFCIDIETSRDPILGDSETAIYKGGLDPYLTRVIMLQMGDLNRQYAIDMRDFTKEELQPVVDLLHWRKDKLLIAHNCLPKETEVLTTEGWKLIENITPKDITYGYYEDEGLISTQSTLDIINKEDEVITFGNSHHNFRATKDHRWLTKSRYGKLEYKTTTEFLNSRSNIVLNSEHKLDKPNNKFSHDELSILTWAITDGIVYFGKKGVGTISITQSTVNPDIVNTIRGTIFRLGLTCREDIVKTEGYLDCIRFNICAKDSQLLLSKFNYTKNFNFCKFILTLSSDELEVFTYIFYLAEGYKKGEGLEKYIFAQIDKGEINGTRSAIALALYLQGYTIGSDKNTIRAKKRQIATARGMQIKSRDFEEVYCITTPTSNFVARQGDKIFLTGNCKFEGKHLRHQYGIRLLNVYDTMLAELCLYNGVSFSLSLAALVEKYLGVKKKFSELTLFDDLNKEVTLDDELLNNLDIGDNYVTPFELELSAEIDKSIRMQFVTMEDEPFTYEQLVYGIEDVIYPILIKDKQDDGHYLLGYHFHNAVNIKLESNYTQVGADMEYNGLPFSVEKWKQLHKDNEKKYVERLKALNSYIINNVPQFTAMTLFGEGHEECMVDWQSPKQVVALFKHFDACPQERSKSTKKLEYTVGAKALLPTLPNDIKDDYGKDRGREIVDVDTLKLGYLLLKKSQMNITTYGDDFLKYVHPITGRVHPNYRLHLISARTATTSPNLLAIPGTHRGAFTLDGTDQSLVVNDYSSQESRCIAAKSGDPLLIDFFNNGHEVFGGDFHSYTSALVHKVRNPESTLNIVPKEIPGTDDRHPEFTGEMAKMRQDTKSVNFGLVYGITALSLYKQLGISLEEAEDLVKGYFETFPDLHEFIEGSKKEANAQGYVIFEDKFQALYIQPNFLKTKELGRKYAEEFFFTDEYKALNEKERKRFKDKLYRTRPEVREAMSDAGSMQSRLGNRGCNLKIQGVSAKQSKVAQINMRKYSVTHPELNWLICLLLHDESVSQCPDEHTAVVTERQAFYMKQAAEYFCPEVTFETSGGAAKYWEH